MSFEIIGVDCKCGVRFMASLKPGKITCPTCGATDEIINDGGDAE